MTDDVSESVTVAEEPRGRPFAAVDWHSSTATNVASQASVFEQQKKKGI